MKDRIDLIQSIKSSESASASIGRQKLVDLGASGSHGLLTEMSLVELRERMQLARQTSERFTKDKHDRIVREKRLWDEKLVDKLQYVNEARRHLFRVRSENEYSF